jgi:hypothetical protein
MVNNNSITRKQTLSLLIPGLLGPDFTDKENEPAIPTLPMLETILSRSRLSITDQTGYEAIVFRLFDVECSRVTDLPVAAVTRIYDQDSNKDEWCMRADPVYLQAEKDCLRLVDSKQLRLDQEQANALVAEIMASFSDDGWRLRALTPERWYLSLPATPSIRTTPVHLVIGRNIEPFLPQGPEGKKWQSFLNETQILLHTATVNITREQRGELPVNSLWFWGGGILPKINRSNWVEIWGNEPLLSGLARQSVTPTSELPASFDVWQKNAVTTGNHLLVLDQARSAVCYQDFEDWQQFLQGLEMNWLEDACKAIYDGTLEALHIYSDTGHTFRFNKKSGKRWWKRKRSLGYFRQKYLQTR